MLCNKAVVQCSTLSTFVLIRDNQYKRTVKNYNRTHVSIFFTETKHIYWCFRVLYWTMRNIYSWTSWEQMLHTHCTCKGYRYYSYNKIQYLRSHERCEDVLASQYLNVQIMNLKALINENITYLITKQKTHRRNSC